MFVRVRLGWLLAACAVGIFVSPANAGTISVGGLITQSTQGGTGPPLNNPALNSIVDGDSYVVTLSFAGTLAFPGAFNPLRRRHPSLHRHVYGDGRECLYVRVPHNRNRLGQSITPGLQLAWVPFHGQCLRRRKSIGDELHGCLSWFKFVQRHGATHPRTDAFPRPVGR